MHTEAGKAFASGLDDWVRVLLAADVEVYADGQGPAGTMARARQAALEVYQARLSSYDGVVDLSLLADDLPPLIVPSMANDLRVSVPADIARADEQALLVLARRWTRMLLVGLPGAGKSTALRQLAARWACDCRAPVPILVSLRPISRRCENPGAVTLSVICEVAALDMPSGQRADLAAALESACQEGRAVLLVDGLDECLNLRAVVTEGLRMMLESLSPETGVILATRSSGVPAAERLGLPTAQLETPDSLDDVLHQLLRHVAAVRVAEPERNAWVANRAQWLEDTRKAHRDIGAVPLLATLLALVAADSTDEQLPHDRATLLMTAVRNSVRRWERHRLGPTEDIAIWPSDGQLLDGYAALGHLLSVRGEVSAEDASACISAMLTVRWGQAPGPAEELTDRILRFWDEHVGVFIGTDAATVIPRSRVFTEIAAAMWAKRLPDEGLTNWVITCVSESDQRVALLLAAQVEPRVMTLLMADEDATTLEVRTLLAAEAVRKGAVLAPEQLEVLLDRLAPGAVAAYSLDRATRKAIPASAADKSEHPDVDQSTPKAVTASSITTATERGTPHDERGWAYTYELA
ncbi:MAG: NACHT domain-containing protein, partial [Actinobacteria bacterium]|nr:NACHT domain-containing protein [Actinomycetota bacterium]